VEKQALNAPVREDFFVTNSTGPLTYPHFSDTPSEAERLRPPLALPSSKRAKLLIHIESIKLPRNEARQAQVLKFKGLAMPSMACQQSYPQQQWIGFEG